MNKKSEAGVPYLVKLVGIAIVLIVFVLITPLFADVMKESVKTGECQWDLLFSALLTQAALGKMNVPPECKTEYITITKEDLDENLNLAAQRIHTYTQNPTKYKKMLDAGFKKYDDIDDNYRVQMEWALNKVVADKMLWCWNRVWRGSLPLFDKWWNLVDWNLFGLRDRDYTEQEVKLLGKEYTDAGLFTKYGPPAFCIICTRLEFSKEVENYFPEPISTLNVWMSYNPAPNSEESYMAELLAGQTVASRMYEPQYVYSTKEPYGIVYKRINPHMVEEGASWVASKLLGIGEGATTINQLALVPYESIVVPDKDGGLSCLYVID